MKDERLLEEFSRLGVDASSHQVLALLPLVEVAWKEDRALDLPRDLILELARDKAALSPSALGVLDKWLDPQSPETIEVAHAVLGDLVRRQHGAGASWRFTNVDEVLDVCEDVAEVAAQLYGADESLTPDQASALEDIARAFEQARPKQDDDWGYWDDADVTDVFGKGGIPLGEPGPAASPVVQFEPLKTAGKAVLVRAAYTQGEPDEVIPIAESLTIGRGPNNDMQIINDSRVSRSHCQLWFEGEQCYLTDSGSTNGTLVNRELVVRHELKDGDEVQVGETVMRFRYL